MHNIDTASNVTLMVSV